MAGKRKALAASPFDDAEIEASIFGGLQDSKRAKRRKSKSQQASGSAKQQADKAAESEPVEKLTIRLPRSLALELRRTYFALAAKHLEHGRKLTLQECHSQMVTDWILKHRSGSA